MIYQPAEDSYLLQSHLSRYVKNKSFLDMGTGSAIQAETARTSGASRILTVDVNPEAVAHARQRGFEAHLSDLFSRVKGKYDIIAFNPPYLPHDAREDPESALITSGGMRGDELICSFICACKKHLAPRGRVLLVLSSLTPQERIMLLLQKQKLAKRVIARKKLFMESLELWEIRRKPQ